MDQAQEPMTQAEALELLRRGEIDEYNKRAQAARPDLAGVDLSGVDLTWTEDGAVKGPWFHTTNLKGANLRGANLADAVCDGAVFDGADLEGAVLAGAGLRSASFVAANLKNATLSGAYVHGACLRAATISGAHFGRAVLSESEVTAVVYERAKMRGKYRGVRGIQATYGDAIFVRDAQDQDYIDTLTLRWHRTWREYAFLIPWRWIDYGRSISRVAVGALVVAILFGLLYAVCPDLLRNNGAADTPFTPFYYSIVTYTTLGLGDVIPANLAGQIVVTIEVILGYLTLGLLLAILATKAARRS